MYYEDTYEDNEIIFISLTDNVKKKIKEDFNSNVEDFIEKEFPQDIILDLNLFNYKGKKDNLIGIKTDKSPYTLFVKRSDNNGRKENYFVAIDIQKRDDIIFDENNKWFNKNAELKIPEKLDRYHIKEAKETLANQIEENVFELELYKTPSLDENQEFQKWYVYLTLLEKLIDAKDFYIETNISYSKDKATVEIDDNEMFQKFIKARGEDFIFYYPEKVDKTKALHEWDEKSSKDNFFGKLDRQYDNNKRVFTFTLSDAFKKEFTDNEHSEIISSSLDDEKFAMEARKYIEKKVTSTQQVKNHILKLENLDNGQKNELVDLHSKLSEKYAHYNEDKQFLTKEEKSKINKTLQLLGDNKSNKFNPREKLILRVSYFRDQFQLKTLKLGLEKIQKHPLMPYLFDTKELLVISDEEVDEFEIKYLSKVLNDKQKEAIKKALISQELFMIQGPPGTGKTEVIAEIAYQEAIRGKKVLITSQANMAVDNAIQRLQHPSLYPIRVIRKDYEPEDGDNLPIEANIGNFYQNRIVKNLKKELDDNEKELKILKAFINENEIDENLVGILRKTKITIPNHLNLKDENDLEDLVRILKNEENFNFIHKYMDDLNELVHFKDIRNMFLDNIQNKDDENIHDEELGYLSSNYVNNINIWGATLFETGKYSFRDKRFDVVIVDEVSKATPPELVLPILKGEKLILVGDHKQLPPIIKDISLEDIAQESGLSLESLDFDTTVFEKLIKNNPNNYVMLDTQYRMHPDIQKAINQFYRDESNQEGLKCGLKNPDLEKCHTIQDEFFHNKHLVWLKIKKTDEEYKPSGSNSYINEAEIQKIKTTLKFLNKQYENKKRPSVGVITFYGRQLGELTKLEKKGYWKLPFEKREFPNLDIRFGTVDRFQGQEKDIVIVSLVRNNKYHDVGFAKKPHRVNVAFSRARNLLIIVGNPDNFIFGKNKKSAEQYGEIFNIAKKFGSVGN